MILHDHEHRETGDEGLDFIYEGEERRIADGAMCFVCHRPLNFPFIQWRGEETIDMHPECALHLTVRLTRDVHEVEVTYGLMTTPPDGRSNPQDRRART